jgi:hypothetical protein
MPQLPLAILPVIPPFAALFSRPTWEHRQVLLTGTLLCQGPRTVAAVLRTMGLPAGMLRLSQFKGKRGHMSQRI